MSHSTREEQQTRLSSLPARLRTNSDADYEDNSNWSTSTYNDQRSFGHINGSSAQQSQLLYYSIKMYNVCKEVAIMMLVVVTYAALTNESPKITKSPSAYPFFSKDSHVKDWYKGQISMAIEQARNADIAFVMFYAPWDAESQFVRQPFEDAARYMRGKINFAAVNCWQPGSECRSQYSKVYKWPVLIAYPTHTRGVQYNGPHDVYHFVKFLNGVSQPLIRITSDAELDHLIVHYDAVVVGHVNASPGSPEFAELYITSLRFLEKDPFQEIAFAIQTQSRNDFYDGRKALLMLHVWNETWIYPQEAEWQSDALINWIFKRLHQVTMWFAPSGMKSLQFSAYVQAGPALILFTPKNPLWNHADYYSMFREMGLEYYNCDENLGVTQKQLVLKEKRVENYIAHKNLVRMCKLQLQESEKFPIVVAQSALKRWSNESYCSVAEKINAIDGCGQVSECNCLYGKQKTHFRENPNDYRSPQNLKKSLEREKCRLLELSHKYFPQIFSDTIRDIVDWALESDTSSIRGLACKTSNASLTMVSLDSLQFYHFAEKLGVDVLKSPSKTAAVIVNEKMETHYIMNEVINDRSIRRFVTNFTQNLLNRALNSTCTLNETKQGEMENLHNFGVYVKELHTDTFLSTVMQPKKVVVVLYYSKQCFFCHGISHMFLLTAKILSSMDFISFARIDGDLNLLPWEYTMESYPTILLFPALRKSESRAFPRSVPITVKNLINFITVNLDNNMKLPVLWSLCNGTKFEEDRHICVTTIRMEILNLIDLSLREWRKADTRRKSEVLHQLQNLRHLHLMLAHSPEDFKTIENYIRKINVISNGRFEIEKIKV